MLLKARFGGSADGNPKLLGMLKRTVEDYGPHIDGYGGSGVLVRRLDRREAYYLGMKIMHMVQEHGAGHINGITIVIDNDEITNIEMNEEDSKLRNLLKRRRKKITDHQEHDDE